ncbi:hypothetical protein AcW2_004687 [Taiwanofungus camphoratus]|nr:hypothetical protein AcW2_004687 [Antrodia cinnamomea]
MLPSLLRRWAPAVLRPNLIISPDVTAWLRSPARLFSSSSSSTDVSSSPSPLRVNWMPSSQSTTRGIPARPDAPLDTNWKFLQGKLEEVVVNVDSTAEEIWKYREDLIVQSLPKPTDAYSGWSNLILNARQGLHDSTLPAGRSIDVYNKDVAAAFAKLRRIIIQNGVVKELRLAERHEKKGDKRRRLKSERWRRRFAYEVRKKVQLVNEIRARGS